MASLSKTEYATQLSEKLLQTIPSLHPSNLISNYTLQDDLSGTRTIFLAIFCFDNKVFLPIEIDALSDKARWKSKENDMHPVTTRLGMLLKVTPKQLEQDMELLVEQISILLHIQYLNLSAEMPFRTEPTINGSVRNAINNKVVQTNNVDQLQHDICNSQKDTSLFKRLRQKILR